MGQTKLKIGASSCLLGEQVRYDGGHKRQEGLLEALGAMVEWVPVCPEVEVGMGVPREPVNLVGDPTAPRMIGEQTGRDWTEPMRAYAKQRVAELKQLGLSGYILKSGSPSCDRERGMFATILRERAGELPIDDEERLRDPARLEDFIGRVMAYHEYHHP
jgi:uncharacterized protein YbbK (DUF523 family)